MRFKLEIQLGQAQMPVEYRRAIISFIKKALIEANDGTYFEKFFNGAKTKDYTFTTHLPNAKFSGDFIELGENIITITFSTYEKLTGYILFAALSEQLKEKFPLSNNNYMKLINIRIINEKEIADNQVLVKLQAPLAIRKHTREGNKDYYYVFSDKEFDEESFKVIREQLISAGYSEEQIAGFKVTPINAKIVIIKHYGCSIPCSIGYMMLEGDKSVINYLYKCGMGSRRSSGFGFIDVVAE